MMRNTYKVFGRNTLNWRDQLEDRDQAQWEVVVCIHLGQDTSSGRVLVNTVINLRITLQKGNFLTS